MLSKDFFIEKRTDGEYNLKIAPLCIQFVILQAKRI